MIEMGLSDDFLKGFKARCDGKPLDQTQSEEWRNGWWVANWKYQMTD